MHSSGAGQVVALRYARGAMDLDSLKWDEHGLVTVVVQDRLSGEIRMLAHANRDAVAATLASGFAHFYSRSRKQQWRKGETSGNGLRVVELWADCDADALIYLADAEGPSCHTNRETCFFRRADAAGHVHEDPVRHARALLPKLWAELDERRVASEGKSYTKSLLDAGAPKINAKIQEEAGELTRAIAGESDERVVSEAADVLYHVLVGLMARGVTFRDVEAELARRFGTSGHDEKAARAKP
jgi:phosphoribosyl-ATP pyrophosphohydrolase/phosphoribosyl-AMP cyclohydrolase